MNLKFTTGTIRGVGRYVDGDERLEIELNFPQNILPGKIDSRINYTLVAREKKFTAGVRATLNNHSWICPDLYALEKPSEKIHLSQVLKNLGYKKNDPIFIFLDESNQIILKSEEELQTYLHN